MLIRKTPSISIERTIKNKKPQEETEIETDTSLLCPEEYKMGENTLPYSEGIENTEVGMHIESGISQSNAPVLQATDGDNENIKQVQENAFIQSQLQPLQVDMNKPLSEKTIQQITLSRSDSITPLSKRDALGFISTNDISDKQETKDITSFPMSEDTKRELNQEVSDVSQESGSERTMDAKPVASSLEELETKEKGLQHRKISDNKRKTLLATKQLLDTENAMI